MSFLPRFYVSLGLLKEIPIIAQPYILYIITVAYNSQFILHWRAKFIFDERVFLYVVVPEFLGFGALNCYAKKLGFASMQCSNLHEWIVQD